MGSQLNYVAAIVVVLTVIKNGECFEIMRILKIGSCYPVNVNNFGAKLCIFDLVVRKPETL